MLEDSTEVFEHRLDELPMFLIVTMKTAAKHFPQ